MEQEKKGIELEVTPEIAEGIYSNLVLISHSQSEFVVDFARILPGVQKPSIKSRIVLTPENAKRLLYSLKENIQKYEQRAGEIKLGNNNDRTAKPFLN